jgi:hypothetical protein
VVEVEVVILEVLEVQIQEVQDNLVVRDNLEELDNPVALAKLEQQDQQVLPVHLLPL